MVVELKRKADVELPPDVETTFNEHYNNVHLPLMLKVPGVVEIHRYKSKTGMYAGTPMEGGYYITEYILESEDIIEQSLSSPERKEALRDSALINLIDKYFTTKRFIYIPIYSIQK